MSGETECSAPPCLQSAFVFERGVGFFDDVAAAVALFPGEGAVGDALEGIQQCQADAGWT